MSIVLSLVLVVMLIGALVEYALHVRRQRVESPAALTPEWTPSAEAAYMAAGNDKHEGGNDKHDGGNDKCQP